MTDFGFKLHKDRQIDFDANDRSVARKVISAEPSFRICIACGTCSATCSAAEFTDFSLRRMITGIKRGEIRGLREEIVKCMLCGKCQMLCPRGVNTRRLVLAIRNAVRDPEL